MSPQERSDRVADLDRHVANARRIGRSLAGALDAAAGLMAELYIELAGIEEEAAALDEPTEGEAEAIEADLDADLALIRTAPQASGSPWPDLSDRDIVSIAIDNALRDERPIEKLHCAGCGKRGVADPNTAKGWTCLQAGLCPACLAKTAAATA